MAFAGHDPESLRQASLRVLAFPGLMQIHYVFPALW